MALKIVRNLLFYGLLFVFSPLFGEVVNDAQPSVERNESECNLPAPDSFQVSSRGPDFVTLSWIPIASGVSHTLQAFVKNADSTWVQVSSIGNAMGTEHTFFDIPFDAECKFSIATNCGPDEPSIIKFFIEDKIILELSTGGRIPLNPVVVPCENMNYHTNKWVGCGIVGHEQNNMFEIEITKTPGVTRVRIKRVAYASPIVAVNASNTYPTLQMDNLPTGNPIKFDRKISFGTLEDIGFIKITLYQQPIIDFCIDQTNHSWDNTYRYYPLVASQVLGEPLEGSDNKIKDENVPLLLGNVHFMSSENGGLLINKPVGQNVELFLLDISGKILKNEQIENGGGTIYIKLTHKYSSPYFLLIKSETDCKIYKIFLI